MSNKSPDRTESFQNATRGVALATEGQEFVKGLWENGVYLGADNFVYQITVSRAPGGLKKTITGKRSVGEYLRWVDGLFRPGALPSEANGIHYRAARKLRELI